MARLRRRKAVAPPPPILDSIECQCEGVWHAYADRKVGETVHRVIYRIARQLSGVWAITVQLPRLERSSAPVMGWDTLREALWAADDDARAPDGIWTELAPTV